MMRFFLSAAEPLAQGAQLAEPVAEKPEAPLLNENTLLQLELIAENGPEGFLEHIYSLYEETAQKAVLDIEVAMDAKAAGRAAHALKSMSLTIGADRVAQIAEGIESRARVNISRADAEVARLRQSLSKTCVALQDRHRSSSASRANA